MFPINKQTEQAFLYFFEQILKMEAQNFGEDCQKKGFKNTHNTAIHAQWHRKLKATFLRVTSKLFLSHNKHSKFPVLNTNFFGQKAIG